MDFVIDAIDSIGPKCGLIEHLWQEKIPFITVLGAGNRIDPSSISIGDLFDSYNCSFAKRIRKFLRKRGIDQGVTVVFSSELPREKEEIEEEKDEVIVYRGRERGTVGSISYMPAIMGMWASSYVIRSLANLPIHKNTKS